MILESYHDAVSRSDGPRPELIQMVGTVSAEPLVSNIIELAGPTPPTTPDDQPTPEPIIDQSAEPQLAIEAISVTELDQPPLAVLAAEKPADIDMVKAEPGTIAALVIQHIVYGGLRPLTIYDMETYRVARQAHQQSRHEKRDKKGVLTAFGAQEDARFSDYYEVLEKTKARLSYHSGWNSAETALL
jgi:hypothetical protein